MILKEEKVVFVHINKCAGSSIEVFFNEYPKDQHWVMKEYEEKVRNWEDIEYVFTVVRNPWDKLVSWFAWCNRDELWYNWRQANVQIYHQNSYLWGMHDGHPKVTEEWYDKFKNPFKKFVKSIKNTNNIYPFPVYEESSWNKGRWVANQTEWLKDSTGELDVDKFLKFENLEEDFKEMVGEIKPMFSEKAQKIFNKQLPKAKVLKNKPHYSLFYDDELIEIVGNLYKEDIDTFNYSFEDERPKKRVVKKRVANKKAKRKKA